jgi:chromosome segregation ATPase
MRALFFASALLGLVTATLAMPAAAQDAGGLESSKDYKDTQDTIKRTQAKIDQVRRENEARAKEIEAVANRVGEVISTMSSQGEDNSNLRSEMQKLAGLLEMEREQAAGLKNEVSKFNERMKSERSGWEKREKELEAKLASAEESSRSHEKRLGAALESIAGHARTNKQLVSDIENLQKELEQLRKENEFLRRMRSSNPSLPLSR